MPPLPQELIDIIIDNLDDDLEALCACSLTCQAWLPSSRKHLFDTLSLDHLDSCHLPYTFSITLFSCKTRLGGLTPYFKNITQLRLVRTVWNELTQDTKSVIYTEFPSVKALTLLDCQFSSFEELLALVSAYPLLRDLSVECLTLGDREDEEPEASEHLRKALTRESSLTSLAVDATCFLGFSKSFSREFTLVNLVELDCSMPGRDVGDVEPLRLLFQSVSTALRQLKIAFSAAPSQTMIDAIDRSRLLSHPFQLKELIISASIFDHVLTPRLIWTLLSQLQVPTLETLVVCGHVYNMGSTLLYSDGSILGDTETWDQVNHILDQPRFSKLRKLEFSLLYASSLVVGDDIEAALSNCFPGFAEKGWLTFKWAWAV
ncbi:hypothetical protein JAAARDRAFT_208943 [Jaapia argillacea MUCL 33604]|uniref:F-box domain-containing protein n=1 Tax=Jaapia argillacea MUCL 33604 TaxID=933084 RepID=A0A067PVE5_9AGAM|nr:hypothetical protein JAAARDRAFT_208943 [Jaapia argillacea MUCL 33604]